MCREICCVLSDLSIVTHCTVSIVAPARAPRRAPAFSVLYFPYNLRLSDGAPRWKCLNDRSAGGPAAPTSWRSQLVGAEEFVRSRRLRENQRLAPSRTCPAARLAPLWRALLHGWQAMAARRGGSAGGPDRRAAATGRRERRLGCAGSSVDTRGSNEVRGPDGQVSPVQLSRTFTA